MISVQETYSEKMCSASRRLWRMSKVSVVNLIWSRNEKHKRQSQTKQMWGNVGAWQLSKPADSFYQSLASDMSTESPYRSQQCEMWSFCPATNYKTGNKNRKQVIMKIISVWVLWIQSDFYNAFKICVLSLIHRCFFNFGHFHVPGSFLFKGELCNI